MADTMEVMPGVEGGEFGGLSAPPPPPPKIAGDDDFAKLAPGTEFIDPTGNKRTKPYEVKADTDYDSVPEGAQFLDPTGALRQKPKFEPIDFTAQTLYDMSITPSEKRKALERTYPGKVKQDQDGLYVEDNGKFRRPGRGISAMGGAVTAAVAPVGLGVLGAIGGGVGGTAAAPGPGTAAGGALGAAGGAVLGQSINDVVLQLAGVYDRSIPEEASNLAKAGLMSTAGFGVGRGLATVVPAARAGVSSLGQALPTAAAHFLGAGPELHTARELAEKGVLVPPSAWAHEAPHLQNVVEVFDPAFRTNKPLMESATKHYENSANKVLEDLGVKREGSIVDPKTAVPTIPAGEKLLQKTLPEAAEADRALQAAIEKRKADVLAGVPEKQAQREAVISAAEQSRKKAQELIDRSFESIQSEAEQARKIAGSGANTGDLWESIGNKLIAVRRGIGERAKYWYDRYDQMTGGVKVSSQELSDTARQMVEELPAEFKSRNPSLVQKLMQLGKQTSEEGEVVKDAEQLTYGQLHDLRSLFRGSADWYTLSSDFKNGSLKRFSKEIDRLIHDPEAPQQIRNAAGFLDMVDKWYGHNIKVFEANQIKAVMKGLEAGEPADPANLYRTVVKEGQTDLTRRVKDMVGPNLWSGVRAADIDTMMNASKTLNPGEINGRAFAKEVLDRHQRGMLEVVHGKEVSEQLLAQARAIEQLEGRLNIPAKPGDTMTQVIARARLAAEEAKAIGNKDPLKTLQGEVKKLQGEMQREANAQKKNDPLHFLYNKSTGASYAVDKILGDEDLILAAAARFGDKSPEFNALRQVYVERVLRGTLEPGKRLEKISPEIQNIMFPGVTRNQMEVLAKEMNLLMETRANLRGDTAGGMAAMAKVEHPVTGLPVAKTVAKFIPGLNPAARAARGKYYALVTDLMTSPTTLRWIEKGLTTGTPEEREAVRNILRAHLQKGAAMGAGAGEAIYQGSGE